MQFHLSISLHIVNFLIIGYKSDNSVWNVVFQVKNKQAGLKLKFSLRIKYLTKLSKFCMVDCSAHNHMENCQFRNSISSTYTEKDGYE